MLQRRIGTRWTSSGWSVSARPRANSRTDLAVRLAFRKVRIKPGSISGGCARPHALHAAADAEGLLEDRAPPEPAGELVAGPAGELGGGDRAEPRRGDAAAIGAVRVAPELARGDIALEVGRNARRSLGK